MSASVLLSIKDLRVSFRMGRTGGVMQRVQAVGRGDGEHAVGVSFDGFSTCNNAWAIWAY